MAFAARLKARREKLWISQPQLAKTIGRRQQTLSNVELGKVERPGFLYELADALLTTDRWLLWGEGPEELPPHDMHAKLNQTLERLSPTEIAQIIVRARIVRESQPKKRKATNF